MFVVRKDGKTYVPLWLGNTLQRLGLPTQIAVDYFRRSSELFDGDEKMVRESRAVSLKELREQYTEFVSVLQTTV